MTRSMRRRWSMPTRPTPFSFLLGWSWDVLFSFQGITGLGVGCFWQSPAHSTTIITLELMLPPNVSRKLDAKRQASSLLNNLPTGGQIWQQRGGKGCDGGGHWQPIQDLGGTARLLLSSSKHESWCEFGHLIPTQFFGDDIVMGIEGKFESSFLAWLHGQWLSCFVAEETNVIFFWFEAFDYTVMMLSRKEAFTGGNPDQFKCTCFMFNPLFTFQRHESISGWCKIKTWLESSCFGICFILWLRTEPTCLNRPQTVRLHNQKLPENPV